jgi:hypothetical protein
VEAVLAGVIQLVECQLPKLDVAGSSPVARSLHRSREKRRLGPYHGPGRSSMGPTPGPMSGSEPRAITTATPFCFVGKLPAAARRFAPCFRLVVCPRDGIHEPRRRQRGRIASVSGVAARLIPVRIVRPTCDTAVACSFAAVIRLFRKLSYRWPSSLVAFAGRGPSGEHDQARRLARCPATSVT